VTGPGPELTLLGKPDCHLCHAMRAVVDAVLPEFGASLVEKDVRDDPETDRLYRLEIPVLLLGDREVARHHVSADALRRRLTELGL
jgi:glutaredoxin